MSEEIPAPGLWDWTPQPRLRGAGRPEHQPTRETTMRVLSLLALKAKPKEVALAIGISVPTLRKQYFSDPKIRAATLVLKGELLAALVRAAIDKDSVAANVELWKRIEKAALKELGDQVADRGRAQPKKSQSEKLGKKAEATANAGRVKGKFAPPDAPLLN